MGPSWEVCWVSGFALPPILGFGFRGCRGRNPVRGRIKPEKIEKVEVMEQD